MASIVDLDRVRRNDDRLSTLQLILSGSSDVDLQALQDVLRVNTKVAEVIIYVDESFLIDLPVTETRNLFATIGGMPNLQKLGFHSQSGSSGVLSVQALIAITSHAARMVHFGISDVALWGSKADFQDWATQLQTQLFLQSFCVCECELLEQPRDGHGRGNGNGSFFSRRGQDCPLDPVLTVLSILPSLEALFLQAATPHGLGELSPEAVGSIGMAPQLQDLRLGNFALQSPHMVQLSHVLPHNTVLSELKLDACYEFHLETAHALGKILQSNSCLKSIELGMASMMSDDCAVVVAKSLRYNTALESFTLSRCAATRFRPTLSPVCQQAFVDMLHQNYALETLVLYQRFPVKKEFKLYLTLNKYGRGKLLQSGDQNKDNRAEWVSALYKVKDDLDSIFYYLSINPNLCRHCYDDDGDDAEDPEKTPEHDAVEGEGEWITGDRSTIVSSLLFQSMRKRSAAAAAAVAGVAQAPSSSPDQPQQPIHTKCYIHNYLRQLDGSLTARSYKRARTMSNRDDDDDVFEEEDDDEDIPKMAAASVPAVAAAAAATGEDGRPVLPDSLDLASLVVDASLPTYPEARAFASFPAAAIASAVPPNPMDIAAVANILLHHQQQQQEEATASLELMALANTLMLERQLQQAQHHLVQYRAQSIQEQLALALIPARPPPQAHIQAWRLNLLLQQQQQQQVRQQQVQLLLQGQLFPQGDDSGSSSSAAVAAAVMAGGLSDLQLPIVVNNATIGRSGDPLLFGRQGL